MACVDPFGLFARAAAYPARGWPDDGIGCTPDLTGHDRLRACLHRLPVSGFDGGGQVVAGVRAWRLTWSSGQPPRRAVRLATWNVSWAGTVSGLDRPQQLPPRLSLGSRMALGPVPRWSIWSARRPRTAMASCVCRIVTRRGLPLPVHPRCSGEGGSMPGRRPPAALRSHI